MQRCIRINVSRNVLEREQIKSRLQFYSSIVMWNIVHRFKDLVESKNDVESHKVKFLFQFYSKEE